MLRLKIFQREHVYLTGNAFVTFVALDDNGKPTPVPTLRIDNSEDQKRFDEGKLRMERRLKQRKN